MKHRNLLLPHTCQIIGWWLLVAAPVFFLLSLLMMNELGWLPQNSSRYFTMITYLLFFFGMPMVALSEEKEEDEMIKSIRADSIVLTAYITIIFFLIWSLTYSFDHGFRFIKSQKTFLLFNMLFASTSLPLTFFLYIVIFKVKLLITKIQSK